MDLVTIVTIIGGIIGITLGIFQIYSYLNKGKNSILSSNIRVDYQYEDMFDEGIIINYKKGKNILYYQSKDLFIPKNPVINIDVVSLSEQEWIKISNYIVIEITEIKIISEKLDYCEGLMGRGGGGTVSYAYGFLSPEQDTVFAAELSKNSQNNGNSQDNYDYFILEPGEREVFKLALTTFPGYIYSFRVGIYFSYNGDKKIKWINKIFKAGFPMGILREYSLDYNNSRLKHNALIYKGLEGISERSFTNVNRSKNNAENGGFPYRIKENNFDHTHFDLPPSDKKWLDEPKSDFDKRYSMFCRLYVSSVEDKIVNTLMNIITTETASSMSIVVPEISTRNIKVMVHTVKHVDKNVQVTGTVENISSELIKIPISTFVFIDGANNIYKVGGETETVLLPHQNTLLDISVPMVFIEAGLIMRIETEYGWFNQILLHNPFSTKNTKEVAACIEYGSINIVWSNNEDYGFTEEAIKLYNKDDFDGALEILDHALSRKPNSSIVYLSRGMIYFKKGNYQDALNDFTQAIIIDPNQHMSYLFRAFTNYKQHKISDSIEDISKLLNITNNEAIIDKSNKLLQLQVNKDDLPEISESM